MSPELSVVIPVFNERDNVLELWDSLKAALRPLDGGWECVWVDDGSADGTWELLSGLADAEPECRALSLARNFGQTAALSAGIAAARGEYIAALDGDLQNDPADIPAMLAAARDGADVVSGWRRDRRDPFLSRVLPSRAANWLISAVTGVRLRDYGCTLKVYRASFLKELELYGEMHRFLPALAGYRGASIKEVPVSHRPRTRGNSKYGLWRIFKVTLDLLTVKFMGDYLTKPIYVFGGTGLLLGLSSAIMAGWTLYNKLADGVFVKDQPLFLVAIFFALVGTQFILLGLIAEMLMRTYYGASGKPPYRVRRKAGF